MESILRRNKITSYTKVYLKAILKTFILHLTLGQTRGCWPKVIPSKLGQQDQEGQAALPAQVRQRSAEEERRNVGHDAGCDCAGGAAAPRTGIPRRRPRTHAHHFWPGNGTVIHITGSIVSAGEYTYTGVPESRKTHH